MAVVIATALPAMAKSWDVCLESADLNIANTVTIAGISQPEFFSAAASIFPSGTFPLATTSTPLTSCKTSASPVGLFLSRGSAVGNLPAETSRSVPDVWLIEWYFRFQSGGAFSTMGPVMGVAPGSTYAQAIAGCSWRQNHRARKGDYNCSELCRCGRIDGQRVSHQCALGN